MEAQTIEEPTIMKTEKNLIYTNHEEVNRVTQEAQGRANMLNQILKDGLLTNNKLKEVATSLLAIDDFIFHEQLKVNKELKKQFDAGKKNLKDEYALPQNLEMLKYALLAWCNYKGNYRNSSKYDLLTFTGEWNVDEEALENHFIRQYYKLYITGEQIVEYQTLLSLCDYMNSAKAEPHQIHQCKFLNDRITNENRKFEPRWIYFRRERI